MSADVDRPADDTPFERMRYYIREIGQGPKGRRDLTRDEARDALDLILRAEARPSQMGGFLLLQRFKGETVDELLGFADAVRQRARLITPRVEGLLDIGSPYDGRRRSVVISPAASLIAAAAGTPIVMHGERDIGPKHGVPVGDILEAMGIAVDGEPEEVERSLEEEGFGYMRSARFVPEVFALRELRDEIALRGALSTIEKLYNLAGASYSLIGLTHVPYAEKMVETVTRMGFRRAMIVQGIEGTEDVPTARPFRVYEWKEGEEIREYRLNPAEFDLQPATQDDITATDAAQSARACVAVLDGEPGPLRDLACFNAALRLTLAGRAADLAEGLKLAREALESGAAREKLEALRERAASRLTRAKQPR